MPSRAHAARRRSQARCVDRRGADRRACRRDDCAFDPPLPDKAEAAAALPLGLANKAFRQLDRAGAVRAGDTQTDRHPRDGRDRKLLSAPVRPAVDRMLLRRRRAPAALEAEGDGRGARFAIEQLVGLLGSGMRGG